MFTIRPAQPGDASGIDAVHLQAFPTDAEARLVALLIVREKDRLSLVAEVKSQVVGHLLFSPASIERPDQTAVQGLGLAPLAVVPQFQRQGIGSALMRAGMEACREGGVPFVVLIGHPDYYPRFGFVPANRYGLTCEFGCGDAFQIAVLREGAIESGGVARYAPEFCELFAPPE